MDQSAVDAEIREREGYIEVLSRGTKFGNKPDMEAIAHHSQAIERLKTLTPEREHFDSRIGDNQ